MYSPTRLTLILFILLFSGLCCASQNHSIVIKDLTSKVLDDQIKVDCEVSYRLDGGVKEALSNGIEMMFRLEIELVKHSPFWIDDIHSSIKREFKVKYHALSKQYVMKDVGSDVERSFPDLYSAFYYQRRLYNAILTNFDSLQAENEYYLRARARLVSEDLPLPLRIKSYLSSSWRLSSGWTIWPI